MLSFLSSFTTVQLQAFSYGFLFFILAIVAFFILTTDYRNTIARRFAYTALFGALINIFAFLYHTVDSIDLARQFRIISQSTNILFAIGMIFFSLTLFEKYHGYKLRLRLIGIALSALMVWFAPLLALDLFGSGHVIGPLLGSPSVTLTPEPGPLLVLYIAAFTMTWLFAAYLMALLWLQGASREARLMGVLMLFCMNLPILTRLFGYGPWYGIESSDFLTLGITFLTGPIFAFGVTYAVMRHKVFNLRLVAAELFVFGMWCFIFFRALLTDSWSNALPDILLLFVTIILGVFLIRSVLKEVEQRERLSVLTAELKVLNETLEERVRARTAELARSKAHVEEVVENLTAGLIEYSGERRILRINRAAEEMLGLKRTAVVGQTIKKRVVPEGLESLYAVMFPETALHYLLPKEQPKGARLEEVHIEVPLSRDLQLTTASVALPEEGKRGYITLVRDITREKQIDRSKSEFLTIAAHQLRTPLTAIRWALRLFLDGGAGRITKAQREILHDGNRAGENMLRIITDLLHVVRIEEGRFGFTFKSGDMGALVSDVVSQLGGVAAERHIKLSADVPAGLPPARIDAQKMQMVVQNLVDNAIKYTLPEGHVRVSLSAMEKAVRLTVADSGIGISAEDRPRLFSRFFRAKRAIEMFTDGSGLGLFIVKSIVDGHSGTIAVKSEPGIGTSITIDIPRADDNSKR